MISFCTGSVHLISTSAVIVISVLPQHLPEVRLYGLVRWYCISGSFAKDILGCAFHVLDRTLLLPFVAGSGVKVVNGVAFSRPLVAVVRDETLLCGVPMCCVLRM